jgi:hypothetical protein
VNPLRRTLVQALWLAPFAVDQVLAQPSWPVKPVELSWPAALVVSSISAHAGSHSGLRPN